MSKESDLGTEIYSPEDIHRVLRIVYPRNWVAPSIFGALMIVAIWFLLFGEIVITAKGNAMFLTRETVIPFQSVAMGQIAKWHVNVGDEVKAGQLLAVLEQPLIEKQLSQARQQLVDLRERHAIIRSLVENHLRLQRGAIERKRSMLQGRISILKQQVSQSKQLTEANRSQNLQSLDHQVRNLQSLRDLEKGRLKELQDELARTQQLRTQRLRSADEVVDATQTYSDQNLRVLDLEVQILQLALTRLRETEAYLNGLNRITDQENAIAELSQDLAALISQETQLERVEVEADFARHLETSELVRTVDRLQAQLNENREIRSSYDGGILELTSGEGRLITRGQRLGALDIRTGSNVLEAVAYFKVKDGKRIKPGMTLRLTPVTVERARFGSLLARVTSVSRFAVSPEAVAKTVGNTSVAHDLTKEGYQIETVVELIKGNSDSGYIWDLTSGPKIDVTSGTIASALATIEKRRPITFVLPVLHY